MPLSKTLTPTWWLCLHFSVTDDKKRLKYRWVISLPALSGTGNRKIVYNPEVPRAFCLSVISYIKCSQRPHRTQRHCRSLTGPARLSPHSWLRSTSCRVGLACVDVGGFSLTGMSVPVKTGLFVFCFQLLCTQKNN